MKRMLLWSTLLCVAAVALYACGQPAGQTAAPAAGGDTIKIGALFAVTGPASSLGAPEQKAAEMLVAQINAAGGVNGKQLELLVRDTTGNPDKALSLCQQLINEDKVFAIIGPSTSGETLKIMTACNDAGVILISCAAAEKIVNPQLPFVFKTPQKDSQAAQLIYAALKKLNLTRVGVMASNTGFGNGGMAVLQAAAPAAGITITDTETYEKEATDLTAVLTKIKASGAQAVINWSIEPAQSIVCKNLRQLNLGLPLFQSHGFGNMSFVTAAGEAANGVIFPCGRLLVVDQLPAEHPQRALLAKFKQDYEAKYSEPVSTFAGHAYDAILILTEAIKKANSTDRAQVRTAIEGLTGLPGTAGVFNFSATDHNGLGLDAFEMLTVKNGQFALYQL